MTGFHHDRQTIRLCFALNQISQLHNRFFLNLGPSHDPFGQPSIFGKTNDVGVLVGQDTNPDLTNDRAKVVAASTAHRNRTHNHEFIEVLGVGKFCNFRAFCVAAFEDFFQIHFGHTPCRVLGVVIVFSIDHHAVQNGLHFLSHFVE